MDNTDLSKLFKIYDSNYDGIISNEEFNNLTKLVFGKTFEHNIDDNIDLKKFIKLMNDMDNNILDSFSFFDENNDGYVDKSLILEICDEKDRDQIIRELYDLDIGNSANLSYNYHDI